MIVLKEKFSNLSSDFKDDAGKFVDSGYNMNAHDTDFGSGSTRKNILNGTRIEGTYR